MEGKYQCSGKVNIFTLNIDADGSAQFDYYEEKNSRRKASLKLQLQLIDNNTLFGWNTAKSGLTMRDALKLDKSSGAWLSSINHSRCEAISMAQQ